MEIKTISAAATVLLAGLLLTGCHKDSPPAKTGSSSSAKGSTGQTNTVVRDLGEVTLTNHYETCVKLGAGRDCIVTPKMIDSQNVQITLAVKSRTATGKTHDLSVTQVVTRTGQPLEVAVGDFSLRLIPNVTTE